MIVKAIIWGFVLVSSAAYATEVPVAAPAKTGKSFFQPPKKSIVPGGSGHWDWSLRETKDGHLQFDISNLTPSQNRFEPGEVLNTSGFLGKEVWRYYIFEVDFKSGRQSGSDIIYSGRGRLLGTGSPRLSLADPATNVPVAAAETPVTASVAHPELSPEDKRDAEIRDALHPYARPPTLGKQNNPIQSASLPLKEWLDQFDKSKLRSDTRGREWKLSYQKSLFANMPGNFDKQSISVTYDANNNTSTIVVKVVAKTGQRPAFRAGEADEEAESTFTAETGLYGVWGVFEDVNGAFDTENVRAGPFGRSGYFFISHRPGKYVLASVSPGAYMERFPHIKHIAERTEG